MSKAYQVIRDFEEEIASFTGAPFAVSVESCSAAIFLSCLYVGIKNIEIILPKFTYCSVPMAIIHAGGKPIFKDIDWQHQGYYQLLPTNIFDSAKCITKGKYIKDSLTCLSFHTLKVLPISRGGMILTDNKEAVEFLRWVRFDGRNPVPFHEDKLRGVGWNMYMRSEDGARGLELMARLKDENICDPDPYQDLSKYDFLNLENK